MSDLQEISRVVYRHDWTSVDQWASTLDQLADLTDDEIVELERIATRPAARQRASQDRRSPSGFWARALTSLRRGCSMLSLFHNRSAFEGH